MTHEEMHEFIDSVAAILLNGALDLIQADPHQWSTRPCSTCRAVGAIAKKPFGCYEYQRRRELADSARTEQE